MRMELPLLCMTERNEDESPQLLSSSQVQTALQQALSTYKLSKYDYVMSDQDIPKLQRHFERALKKKQTQKQPHLDVVASLASGFANTLC